MEVAVAPIKPTTAFAAALLASVRVIERGDSRIGYIHVWASNESNTFKAALERLEPKNIVLEQLRKRGVTAIPTSMREITPELQEMMKPPNPLDFLVVDMRGRVGGNIAAVGHYLEALDARDYWGRWRSIGRSGGGIDDTRPRNPPFRGRSALLIDHHTRSAAEFMAYGYKRGAFGPLIGMPTAGAVSSGALWAMPGDLLLYVAVGGHEHDGGRLEGVGVAPDHLVERPLPHAAGADPVLDAAIEHLVKRAAKQPL